MSNRDLELILNQQSLLGETEERKDSDDAVAPSRKLKPDEYTVGWLCAIKVEYVAAQEFLDEEHEGPEPDDVSPQDNNNYALGSIGKHNVVIATLPLGEYGIASAATVARDMMHSFPNVRIGLMVGIGGGAPSEHHDIRLGDVVVSAPRDGDGGLFQYDFGKNMQDQSYLTTTGFLNQPPTALRTALAGLQAQYERKGHRIEQAVNSVLEKNKRLRRQYKRPDQSSDRFYQPGVVHPNTKEGCSIVCDPSGLIPRPERAEDEDNPAIHYGLIASANQLMKNAFLRDKLAAERDVLCFEMEASGLMNHFPCLVIRGICDYADSHKNNEWQGYAAMVAAAYAKDLLYRIAPNSVTAERRIKDILTDVQETVKSVGKDVHKLIHKQHSQEHQAILDWLTPVDYASQHNDFIRRQQEGTGRWFLESVEFQVWLKTTGQTLFCPGIPGAGKTIITAIVIDHLLANFRNDPHVGIAYIYCDFRQQDKQKVEDLLTNLLKQLAQAQSSLPKAVKDLYDEHEKSRTRPSLDKLTTTLHSMASVYSRTFIIIDALDECQDLSRLRLLDEVFDLQAKTGANIFATSRINDTIRRRFDGSATVEISADERDVLAYLDGQMALRRLDIINDDIRDKIRDGVLKAAGGMFLLATFQIDTIMSQPTRGEIKEVLQKLGRGVEGLHDIYKQAMERIEGHTDAIRFLAKRILIWITHAKRPLSITEMQHALAVREHMTAFDTDYMPDVKDLKSVCAGLVMADEESGIIQLVHYTTQEFFQQTQGKWFPEAEAYISKICATYLSFDTFASGVCQLNEELEDRLQSNPLYDYAARNWGHHAREASTIGQEVIRFLECEAKVEASHQVLMSVNSHRFYWHSQLALTKMTGLHLAAYFGVERAVGYLTQSGYSPDVKDTGGRTPLSWAAENGSAAVAAKLLATRLVEADSSDNWNKTPLFYAVTNNHERVVKLLLEAGVNVDSKNYHHMRTSLLQAATNGNVAIAKLLLENGAVIDLKDHGGMTPLTVAAECGHEALMQLLLDNGADLEGRDGSGQTPLALAAECGHKALMQLLLDNGAKVEVKNHLGQTPLALATENEHEALVQLLLENGANAKVQDDVGQTPLSLAAGRGLETVVQLLLDKGADLESRDKNGQTPLSWAAENGQLAIVQLLLDKGANVESTEIRGRTPLSYAVENAHKAMVRLLLDNGADIDSKEGGGRTPLSIAAAKGYAAVVQQLLDKGASPNLRDVEGRTPLSYAAEHGYTAIVQLLLDKAANFESMDEELRPTPLPLPAPAPAPAPAVKVDMPIVQQLLDSLKDIDLNKKLEDSRHGRTPQSWAAENWHVAIAQLFLDQGSYINFKDYCGQTPLSYAAMKGRTDTVQLLLDRGADMTLPDMIRRTPLFLAQENGHTAVVQLLVDRGARRVHLQPNYKYILKVRRV